MPRVLIVDDRPDQARLVSALLEAADFETETADSGEAALGAVRDRTPDLIVTDLVMPGLSGLDVVEAVRASHPSLPVVLMTAHGNGEIAARALKRGAASYVPKRLLHEILVDIVTDTYELSCSIREEARVRDQIVGASLEFMLENDPALVTPLVNFLQRHVTRHAGPVDENQLMQVGVAVHEALTNAIIHGNLQIGSDVRESSWAANQALIDERRRDERFAARRVRVRASVSGRELRCEIADEGEGFDPSLIPDPTDPANILRSSGRGLYLIGTFMDAVRFNDIGNTITMVTTLEPAQQVVEADDDGA